MWKDPDETRQLDHYENIIYNYKKNVYCTCMETGDVREMSAGGFKKHYIRGFKKMKIKCGIALCIMLQSVDKYGFPQWRKPCVFIK